MDVAKKKLVEKPLLKEDHDQFNDESVVVISYKAVVKWLFGIAILLLLINWLLIFLTKIMGLKGFFINALSYYFDAGQEGNIPTLFSTLILSFAACILLITYRITAKRKKIQRIYWLGLGAIFIFLTIDESTQVHEQFNKLQGSVGDRSGYLYYSWILPYAIAAVALGLFFIRFLITLPWRTKKGFVFSGLLYVSAALGFELFEGRVMVVYGADHLYSSLLCSVEEFLEMTGIILFIHTLLVHISMYSPSIILSPSKRVLTSAKNH